MKKKNTMFCLPPGRSSDRSMRYPAPAISASAVALFLCAAANIAPTYAQRPEAPLDAQDQPTQIGEEETKAYLAARQEADAHRRALRLTEFVQKYPESTLMQPSDHEIVKRLQEEYDAYYPIQRETDFDNRAAKPPRRHP